MDSQKKQKLYQERGTKEGDDIISSFPDCILTHILSFLPTKDAISTCILSTRWRDLWAGIPNIDIDDRLMYFGNMDKWPCFEYEYGPFMNFVDRILVHRQVPNIARFRLSCRVCFCPSRISEWISSAVRLKVQELDLSLVLETPFDLPSCLFNCPSLRVLKINMECALVLPKTVSLPNIKTLCLALVEFLDRESAHKLLSSCPTLEELCLLDCDWGRLDSFVISVPTLRRLRIDDALYQGSPNESRCTIKMHVPNLVSFDYFGYFSNEIWIPDLSFLVEASIFLPNIPERTIYPAWFATNLINDLENVKVLRTSTDTIKFLTWATRFFGQLPVFQKVTQMELTIGFEKRFLLSFLQFLKKLPSLEILSFPAGLGPHLRLSKDFSNKMSTAKCYLSKLRLINFHFVHGSELEMSVLKYLVESAPALETVEVICSRSVDSKKSEIRLQVQMLLDGSRGNLTML